MSKQKRQPRHPTLEEYDEIMDHPRHGVVAARLHNIRKHAEKLRRGYVEVKDCTPRLSLYPELTEEKYLIQIIKEEGIFSLSSYTNSRVEDFKYLKKEEANKLAKKVASELGLEFTLAD